MPPSNLVLAFMLFIIGFCNVFGQDNKIKGYFWHITDTHADQNYSIKGNPDKMCHEDGKSTEDIGLYGNFLCDSPQYLVSVTVKSMKDIQPSPDFIIWTGDNLPHTSRLGYELDWNATFEAIKNLTVLLSSNFPEVPILPSIGNHDTFPTNMLPGNTEAKSIYQGYLEEGGWSDLLTEDARSTFLLGGFYSYLVKPGLRIISLNTILWYTPNHLTSKMEDPGNQLKWLENCLKNSSNHSEKVYIIGHVPPGFYNRVVPGDKSIPTYFPQHSKRYLDILLKYDETIAGQFYGHIHLDMFQVFQYNTGTFKGSSLLASSVTPWYGIDKYNVGIPVNPAVRLLHYSPSNASLLDFDQYYLNLTKANSNAKKTEVQKNLYEKLYTFTDVYGVPDLSTESLVQVYELMKNNQTVFDSFFKFLTAGKEYVSCDNDCKVAQLCAMSSFINEEYDVCMKSVIKPDVNTSGNTTSIIVYSFVSISLLIGFIVLFILYKRHNKSRARGTYENFPHL